MASVSTWARFCNLGLSPHNMLIERYHGVIKRLLKPFMRLDQFMITLIKVNDRYHRKDVCISCDIRGSFQPSVAQKQYRSLHTKSGRNFHIVAVSETQFNFHDSEDDPEVLYTVTKNLKTCNKNLCKVTCPESPSGLCAHDFVCSCDWYSFQNVCYHLHIDNQYCTQQTITAQLSEGPSQLCFGVGEATGDETSELAGPSQTKSVSNFSASILQQFK